MDYTRLAFWKKKEKKKKTTFLYFFIKYSPSPLGLKMGVVIDIRASIQESHISKPKQFVLYKVGK